MTPTTKTGSKGSYRISIFKELFLPSLDPNLFTDSRTGVVYDLSLQTPSSMSDIDLESCFNLVKETSELDYRSSSLGWKPISKKSEMKLPDLQYLLVKKRATSTQGNSENAVSTEPATTELATIELATTEPTTEAAITEPATTEPTTNEPIPLEGFISFMITYENNCKVIYVYEIHLTPELRGSGLGAHLMGIMEDIGQKADGVKKAMLTAFVSNTRAIRFYEKLGYTEDEYSPKPKRLRSGMAKPTTYVILSKNLR